MFAALASAVPATSGAAAAIPHISASNTTTVPSAASNPDDPVAAVFAASVVAAAIPASEFQETLLKGRRGTDHKALRSSSKVFFIMNHVAKQLTTFLGHVAKC